MIIMSIININYTRIAKKVMIPVYFHENYSNPMEHNTIE